MKRFLPGLVLGLASGVAIAWWSRPGAAAGDAVIVASAAAETEAVSTEVTLSPAAVEAAGIETAVVRAVRLRDFVTGYSRALDPAPLLAIVRDHETAQAALTASQRERDRLRALYAADENVSARAVEVAEAEVARDAAAEAAARDRLRWEWGPAFADEAWLGELVVRLRAGESGLVRVDLVAGERVETEPETIALEGADVAARVIGAAPQADAQLQGAASARVDQ